MGSTLSCRVGRVPTAAPHPCATPSCPNLVARGVRRCPSCRLTHDRARGTSTARGYGADWRAIRRRHLRREPCCRGCAALGIVKAADTVDHVVPWQGAPTQEERERLRTDEENLQSLCQPCHNKKTIHEDGGFGHRRLNHRAMNGGGGA